MDIENLQNITTSGWNSLHASYEEGRLPGIEYPTEALVIFVAIQKKSRSIAEYFDDVGKEWSLRRNFVGNALEIGFGTIANLKMVSEKGYRCFGLEVSQEAVNRGNKVIANESLTNIQLLHWKPYSIPFPSNYFSLVYGLGCIYYNLELELVIDEIYRVMLPGANCLFSFFSKAHTYMNFLEKVSDKIYRWSKEHPNPRLRGICLRRPASEEELSDLFGKFSNFRIFTTESNQTPLFESWWYVTASKPR